MAYIIFYAVNMYPGGQWHRNYISNGCYNSVTRWAPMSPLIYNSAEGIERFHWAWRVSRLMPFQDDLEVWRI